MRQISADSPELLQSYEFEDNILDVFVEPTTGRVFGTSALPIRDDLGLSVTQSGFELVRSTGEAFPLVEANIPFRDSATGAIVAIPVPEPAGWTLVFFAVLFVRIWRRTKNNR